MPRLTEAQRDLVAKHIELAAKAVSSSKVQLEPDDAKQEAAIGLCMAAMRFEPDRGLRFGTIAWPRAAGAIIDAARSRGRAIRVSRSKLDTVKHRIARAEISGFADPASVPEKQSSRDLVDEMRRAIALLDGRERRVAERRARGDYIDQIAAELGVSTGTVCSDIRRIETHIRAFIETEGMR